MSWPSLLSVISRENPAARSVMRNRCCSFTLSFDTGLSNGQMDTHIVAPLPQWDVKLVMCHYSSVAYLICILGTFM